MSVILKSISLMVLFNETFASSSRFSHQKCGLYGQPPCIFVPSTTGVTPLCATPGKTYCEFVPNYPVYTIRVLLDKWGIDNVNDLIVDESVDEFEAPRFPNKPSYNPTVPVPDPNPNQTPTFTEPPNAVSTEDYHHPYNGGYEYPNPNNVHTTVPPPPPQPSTVGYLPTNGYTINHNPGANRYWSGYSYTINQRPTSNTNQIPGQMIRQPYLIEPRYTLPQYIHSHPLPLTAHRAPRLVNRYRREVIDSLAVANSRQRFNTTDRYDGDVLQEGRRNKRQSPGREQLCETAYQYITPQAALNSQGNWMYIVNQIGDTRQLVRTEICASTICSNICSLPNGYSSRCEQKYVQKRLVALNADGTNLYTDTFWFPSCCACTIAGPTTN